MNLIRRQRCAGGREQRRNALPWLRALFPARLGFYYALVGTLGQDALWLSFPFGSFVGVALAIVAYRRKGWRLKARAISPERAAEEVNTNGEAVGRFKPDM